MSTLSEPTNSTLKEAWKGILLAKPGLRIRDAARQLGVSEATLLATRTGDHVVRLQGPWPDLLKSFKRLGKVMSLTRNDSCILEHKGAFQEINVMESGSRAMATVIGPIETRVFFSAWHVAFAVTEEKSGRELKSIQVFDKAGDAITKIYLQEGSHEEAFTTIIEDFRAPEQYAELGLQPYPAEEFSTAVNAAVLLKDWSTLKDTHDFFGMIRRHQVHRYDAITLAKDTFTYPVDPAISPKQILDDATTSKLPIMIFAGNRGNLQIHQGKVRTIRVLDRGHTGEQHWLNILDPDFNMHLRMEHIDSAWVVKKPTDDGEVTSVELFDRDKNLIVQFFGLRKPGIPEREGWRNIIERLPKLP